MSAANVNPIRLQQLIDQANRLPPNDRAAYVKAATAHDEPLRGAALAALALMARPMPDRGAFWRPGSAATGDEAMPPTNVLGLHEGRRIGDFTLLRFLGRGGMGQVWEARQESLRRHVALKLMLPGRTEERTLELFVREAQAGGKCHHPNLVATLARGEDSGIAWLAQELVVAAQTLDQALDHYRDLDDLPSDYYRQVAVLIEKVALGLQSAHDAGVIHRDLKPQNILIGEDGEPRVADFGLARVAGDSIASRTGDFAGTYFYMSPEQVAAKRIGLDHRTDIWSLGVVLYEMLTLQRPFVGDTGPQIAQQITHWDPPRADLVRSRCPRDLGIVAEKAVQKLAVQRYPSMAAFAADLRRHLENQPVLARPAGRIERVRKWTRRNPTIASTLVTAVVGALGATGLAMRNLDLARAEARAREDASRLALDKGRLLGEYHQLSGVVRLSRASERQEHLWPAWPGCIAGLRAWLETDCAELLALRPLLQSTIADLRARALPSTPAEIEADRRSSPEWPALARQLQLVTSLRRRADLRTGRASLQVPALPAAMSAAQAEFLLTFAWQRVAPERSDTNRTERIVFGEESIALAAARTALERATGTDLEGKALEALAFASLANGLDEAASAAARKRDDARSLLERLSSKSILEIVDHSIANSDALLARAEARLAELEALVATRRTWTFHPGADGESARFLLETLTSLLSGIEALDRSEKPDVELRLAFAEQVGSASRAHPKAAVTWEEARRAIATADGNTASTAYAGLSIPLREDQVIGLVPIGSNPVTKLWEFYDLRSAWDGTQPLNEIDIPRHRADGTIEVVSGTGIVFVLLPGGTVTLGSQRDDPRAAFYDPIHQDDEELHQVVLQPFLLARHEMTQAQWARLCTWNPDLRWPSSLRAGTRHSAGLEWITPTHPVEHLDWPTCDLLLTRHGMQLPTEAQWEYACRAGTSTPWSANLDALEFTANLASLECRKFTSWTCEDWVDRYVGHAPVGSFAANGFGLFDLHGNVWEWCRDLYGRYGTERPGDGLRMDASTTYRVNRGAAHCNPAIAARSAARDCSPPDARETLGLRAARRLEN